MQPDWKRACVHMVAGYREIIHAPTVYQLK
jgi:hypothetical protein